MKSYAEIKLSENNEFLTGSHKLAKLLIKNNLDEIKYLKKEILNFPEAKNISRLYTKNFLIQEITFYIIEFLSVKKQDALSGSKVDLEDLIWISDLFCEKEAAILVLDYLKK